VHPRACLEFDGLSNSLKKQIQEKSRGYPITHFFREKMVEGVATIAAAFWPKPVIVRLSTSSRRVQEAAGRRALRARRGESDARLPRRVALCAESFRECFELECAALKKVRDELGFVNVELMVLSCARSARRRR